MVADSSSNIAEVYVNSIMPLANSPHAGQELAEYAPNAAAGSPMRKFVYADYIDEPVMMLNVSGATETKYYYHQNNIYSVAALTRQNGTVEDRYYYDPYGYPMATLWSTAGNPYQFTGRRYDIENDCYYYRARYYDASDGRFMGRDPIGYQGGINLYEYVGDRPLDNMDPSGLMGMMAEEPDSGKGGKGKGDWKPSDCPKTCKEHYGEGLNQETLDALARKLKAGGGNVDSVYFSSDCGGTTFSLACPCTVGTKGRHGKPVSKRVLCVNTTTNPDTCSAMIALQHEFYHAQSDKGLSEDAAYRKSCQDLAKQECWRCDMPEDEKKKKIEDCVKKYSQQSKGKNTDTIKAGCKKVCDDYVNGTKK